MNQVMEVSIFIDRSNECHLYVAGETCVNNEDLNGTRFGSFRCPLNGFPYEAKYCCGEYGKQYCCIREGNGFVSTS